MKVIVAGGGYGGVMAANRLAGNERIDVTLVEPQEQFVERIRLHEFAAGARSEPVVTWDQVLHPRIEHVQTRMESIDQFASDFVIIATGASSAARPNGTYSIGTLLEAQTFRTDLDDALATHSSVTVRVVGGGLTGVELASELAEQARLRDRSLKVVLHAYSILPGLSDWAQTKARVTLTSLGVQLQGRFDAPVSNGDHERSDELIVWCGGFTPTPAPHVAPTLQSIDDPRVFVVGDAAASAVAGPGQLQMRCASAMPMGVHAADQILSLVAEPQSSSIRQTNPPLPFNVGYMLTCISLGRRNGIVQVTRGDGTSRNFVITGVSAARIKESICQSTVRWMRKEAAKPGTTSWKFMPRLNRGREPHPVS